MSDEVAHDLSPIIKANELSRSKDGLGRVNYSPLGNGDPNTRPQSLHLSIPIPQTGVQSKDVVISNDSLISARLFIPKSIKAESKLLLLVYFHGSGFCIESAFSPTYHNYLNDLVSEANVVAVSVNYRLAPEHPLPAAYDDSWAALKWVGSHFGGTGPEEWLNRYADLDRVFFSGDGAGANIAHNMGVRFGSEKLEGFKLAGIVLVHPYFWGEEPIGGELVIPEIQREKLASLWRFAFPSSSGYDDLLFNPSKNPKLGELGCGKVLVCVAEKDALKDRGWYYSESLKKSGWNGVVEVWESKEEQHVFHLYNPNCENTVVLRNKIVSFMN